MGFLIYIEGIIGAGKSTFIHNISKEIPAIRTITEPVEAWQEDGILGKYYEDMKRWGFPFQLRIIHDKVETINNLPQDNNHIYMIERSLYSDQCFSNTLHDTKHLEPFEFKLANDIRETYDKKLNFHPSLIIYLRPPLETCMERVATRNRKEEQHLTSEYQEILQNHHDDLFHKEYLKTSCGCNIPIMILEDNDITPELIQKIKNIIKQGKIENENAVEKYCV